MPKNKFQKIAFAFMTVLITVHAYVFYSLYVINGDALRTLNQTTGVIDAINKQGGVYMLGNYLPIWAVIVVEFILALSLEILLGSPLSFKIASRSFDPQKTHPVIFETMVICSTVLVMCPAMSLLAAFLYYPYYAGFNVLTLLANWLKLICCNFPFALISQIFFIQPVVRKLFKLIFARNKERAETAAELAPSED